MGAMKKRILLLLVPIVLLVGIGAYFLEIRAKPQYGWLVFGPDAKVRVLVCLDGQAVSLTHYINGQPTGRKERFRDLLDLKEVAVIDPDKRTSYVITGMHRINLAAAQT